MNRTGARILSRSIKQCLIRLDSLKKLDILKLTNESLSNAEIEMSVYDKTEQQLEELFLLMNNEEINSILNNINHCIIQAIQRHANHKGIIL